MNIQGIDHEVLRVHYLEGAVDFYHLVLDCPVERRQDAIAWCRCAAGRSPIDLVTVDGTRGRKGGAAPGRHSHNMGHLYLARIDIDTATVRDQLESQGVAVGEIGSRSGAGGEGLSLYFTDPEGNRLKLRGA